MKKQLLVGIAVSAICLYFALKGIPLSNVAHVLAQAKLGWVLSACAIYLMGYALRIWRWKILLSSVVKLPYGDLAAPLIIGFFANNLLPFRMGEFVRAHISGKKFKISRTTSLGSIFIERLFDTISLLTIFLGAMGFYPFPTYIEKGALILGVCCFITIAVLWIILTRQALFELWIHRLGIKHEWALKIEKFVRHFAQGASGLRNPRQNTESLALSLVIWCIEGLFSFLMAKALGVPITIPGAFFLLFFLGLSVTIPQAPGNVGTMEFVGVMALSILNVPREQGLSLILAVHASQFLMILGMGFWALHHEGLTVANLFKNRQTA
jgi:uncharacterized protein (TIRG00374 family)